MDRGAFGTSSLCQAVCEEAGEDRQSGCEVLAQLLRMDYLPESYVPRENIGDLRTIVRHRASLVRLRTSIKNALLALSEIGEIERFRKPKSFVSYAGLAPKVE